MRRQTLSASSALYLHAYNAEVDTLNATQTIRYATDVDGMGKNVSIRSLAEAASTRRRLLGDASDYSKRPRKRRRGRKSHYQRTSPALIRHPYHRYMRTNLFSTDPRAHRQSRAYAYRSNTSFQFLLNYHSRLTMIACWSCSLKISGLPFLLSSHYGSTGHGRFLRITA